MAKKSKIARNEQRREVVKRYATTRAALKKLIRDPKTPDEKKAEAVRRLQKIPRDASPVRIRNRCQVTGRPRAYLRKFSMSRIALRDLGNSGQIAGLKKASW
jgi:small subunit ribosomal protein S14